MEIQTVFLSLQKGYRSALKTLHLHRFRISRGLPGLRCPRLGKRLRGSKTVSAGRRRSVGDRPEDIDRLAAGRRWSRETRHVAGFGLDDWRWTGTVYATCEDPAERRKIEHIGVGDRI